MTFAATLLLLVLLAGGRLVALTTGDGGDPGSSHFNAALKPAVAPILVLADS